MNKRDLLSIAFRVFGLVWLADGILSIPWIAYSIHSLFTVVPVEHDPRLSVAINIASVFLTLLVGYWFFIKADRIAARFTASDETPMPIPPMEVEHKKAWFELTARAFGLILMFNALINLVKRIAQVGIETHRAVQQLGGQLSDTTEIFIANMNVEKLSTLIGAIVSVALGLYLLLGGGHLADLVFRNGNKISERMEADNV